MKFWYTLQTKPKRETDVLQQLSRVGFDLFCPWIKTLTSLKPLFPSYLFIKADCNNAATHRLIRYTRGLNRILGSEEGPTFVADIIVETLRERTRDGAVLEQELIFKEGDEVRIKKGVLKDLQGMIAKNMPTQGRVRVLFKWLNNQMSAVLKYTDLEKAA